MKLTASYYLNDDVVFLARDLLGKVLYTNFNSVVTAGIITETEAYNGISDKACHAYNGRCTKRTSVMFREGGLAYVYLCYGIHSLFNVVTGKNGDPKAVLLRAVYPFKGKEQMLKRLNKEKTRDDIYTGPGKVTKALDIHYFQSGTSLLGEEIWIEDKNFKPDLHNILTTKRIGIDYAEEDKHLPYRFLLNDLSAIIT